MTSVHFMSETDEWATPPKFVERMSKMFGEFTLDPCALPSSAKAPLFFTPEDDGLSREWTGKVWMNPPYGREIGKWTTKARTSISTESVVGLLPARTDTEWWHRDVMGAAHRVLLVRGRLRFGEATASAPFPSAVVLWVPSSPRQGVVPEFGAIAAK